MVRNSGPKSPGSKESTFNSKLSELDSLLDDLNCARIIGTNHRPNNQFGGKSHIILMLVIKSKFIQTNFVYLMTNLLQPNFISFQFLLIEVYLIEFK